MELGSDITLVNIYGPCLDGVTFWNNLLSKYFMHGPNLVVGGDLIFSLGMSKTWGPQARVDHLAYFFLKNIREGNLIDSNLIKITPTWRNKRVGEARVAKRLDRFLLNDDLAS